jgi:hypothetical protein
MRKAILTLSCILLVTMGVLLIAANQGRAGEVEKDPDGKAGLQIMPRVGVSLEYGGFMQADNDFTSRMRRRLDLDMLQYGNNILYLEFDESTFLGTPGATWNFNQVRYRIHVFGWRYNLPEHYVGLFFNHWCDNLFLTDRLPVPGTRLQDSTYLLTLEFLSKSMRLGMKDRGISFDPARPFEFLGRWHYAASVGRFISRSEPFDPDLNWVLNGALRYDILRYRRLIPYVEFTGETRVGPSVRFSPLVEVGVRWHLYDQTDITPFFQWGRAQTLLDEPAGSLPVRRAAISAAYGGVRVETLLDGRESGNDPEKDWQLLPEIHGNCSYFLALKSRYYGWGGNLDVDLEVLRRPPWTLFFYSQFKLDTRKRDLAIIRSDYQFQYGLTYTREPFFIEGFIDNTKWLDVHTYQDDSSRANLGGVRAGTRGMKPGHVDDGIKFPANQCFQWLNNYNGQLSLGHFFNNLNWQYLWGLSGQVRWDILRWHAVIPYAQVELAWLSGGGATPDAVNYAAEQGLRFHGRLDLSLYFRFQHQENARYFRSPADNASIIGLRTLF